MDWRSLLEERPIVVALAGSNGAGKSTFFHAHLAGAGLRFINADDLAAEMRLGHVVMIFIRIDSPDMSRQRVAMRVLQGGHDVPDAKLEARFHRTLANLERAIKTLSLVVAFDNRDLNRPFRLAAVYQGGERIG
jgi:predicted ABC-type ATPase